MKLKLFGKTSTTVDVVEGWKVTWELAYEHAVYSKVLKTKVDALAFEASLKEAAKFMGASIYTSVKEYK